MSIKSMMPSNPLILCHSLLLQPSIIPRVRIFLRTQFFESGGQSIRMSPSVSVLPMNIQGSVQFSSSVLSDSLWPHESQHAGPPCPSPTPGVHSDSCPLNRWCYPTILSSVFPFSHLQSFPAPGSFQMSQFIWSDGQSTRGLVSASVPPMNIQSLCPLGWTGWISLQSKGLSRVFSNTTVQKYQFFGSQPYS